MSQASPHGTAANLNNIPPSARVALTGFSSPSYRGPLTHGVAAELVEGFRVLTSGQKNTVVNTKDLCTVMQNVGLHSTEEELQDLLRVVHQDERTDGLEFSEFMLLMTKEADESMIEAMCSAFQIYDKTSKGMVTKKQFAEMFVSMGEHSSAEELEELLALTEVGDDSELIDYKMFVAELALRLNKM